MGAEMLTEFMEPGGRLPESRSLRVAGAEGSSGRGKGGGGKTGTGRIDVLNYRRGDNLCGGGRAEGGGGTGVGGTGVGRTGVRGTGILRTADLWGSALERSLTTGFVEK